MKVANVIYRCAESRDSIGYDDYHAMLREAIETPCYCQPCDDQRLLAESMTAWSY